ncbi:hypothetical protein ACJDU8_02350 [Clostridium sp. WILCCON 0269]|uniref:Uncharacterized protein n=1 Tax=Candidatus Clostridium eludens TaxID=3381663 RepID=A0ABW8SFC9_9CLOT
MNEILLKSKDSINTFLGSIDLLIKDNLTTIKCCDMYELYFHLFNQLKIYRGTSSGFMGYSELLLFRFLYNMFSEEFSVIPFTKDVNIFKIKDKREVFLSQGAERYKVSTNKKIVPDISVKCKSKLIAVCEIKVFLTNGVRTINDVFLKLKELQYIYPDVYTVLIIYINPGKMGSQIKLLEEYSRQYLWFNYIILQDNNQYLYDLIKDKLNLTEYLINS